MSKTNTAWKVGSKAFVMIYGAIYCTVQEPMTALCMTLVVLAALQLMV